MTRTRLARTVGRGLACGAALAAGAYATYAAATWFRYGKVQPAVGNDRDPLLDRFMPTYEVVERHHLYVRAPADISFAAACDVDLQRSAIVQAIFKGRELQMGSDPDASLRPCGLLALTKSLGWGVLAEIPGLEVVVGAITQPWKANVVFRPRSPDEFAVFDEPGYVKIAWTIRSEPAHAGESVVRTETRVVATDAGARRRFRRYWSVFSHGIVVIRRVMLPLVKAEAERRAVAATAPPVDRFELVSAGDLDRQC